MKVDETTFERKSAMLCFDFIEEILGTQGIKLKKQNLMEKVYKFMWKCQGKSINARHVRN